MPPMATPLSKRKWSEVFGDKEVYDKQSIMDLCTSKLRYVNPARPPRRRTEVPLLRNVLIVNTMKHLSGEVKSEGIVDYSSSDLSVEPGHFDGLPPLSEMLDIMLDPQPCDQQQVGAGSIEWSSSPVYPSQPTLDTDISSYPEGSELCTEEKIVHDMLSCLSVLSNDPAQNPPSWNSTNSSVGSSNSWQESNSLAHQPPVWNVSSISRELECFLSCASDQASPDISMDTLGSDTTFQPLNGRLPSFSSLFESTQSLLSPPFPEMLPGSSSQSTSTASSLYLTPSLTSFQAGNGASTDEFVSNNNLTESELELLAMTFLTKLPLSFEDLIQTLPHASLLQQTSQHSQTFNVPSSLQGGTAGSACTSASSTTSQCASFCRKDQPPPSVDESSMVGVLVNL